MLGFGCFALNFFSIQLYSAAALYTRVSWRYIVCMEKDKERSATTLKFPALRHY
ncbi:hypothetical protein MA16_Dca007645 [Dendrobium catenatum]|uniref:Uncharacterized protein n=1 Tax=Dendrobium catenatum TaxID=906689 RepID=A0A2I0X0T6_9ASPA|nr:hypothetical protein MA16_Dca007645 [Dendrobium catenatum]